MIQSLAFPFNRKLTLIVISTGFSVLIGCKSKTNDCAPPYIHTYMLTPEAKNKVPYFNSTTLVYISDALDTVTLTCPGKQSGFETEDIPSASGCDPNKNEHEINTFSFNSSNPSLVNGVKVMLYQHKPDESPQDSSVIELYFMTSRVSMIYSDLFYLNYEDTISTTSGIIKRVKKSSQDGIHFIYYNDSTGIVAFNTDRFWRLMR